MMCHIFFKSTHLCKLTFAYSIATNRNGSCYNIMISCATLCFCRRDERSCCGGGGGGGGYETIHIYDCHHSTTPMEEETMLCTINNRIHFHMQFVQTSCCCNKPWWGNRKYTWHLAKTGNRQPETTRNDMYYPYPGTVYCNNGGTHTVRLQSNYSTMTGALT